MDCLLERFVDAREKDQDLGLALLEVTRCLPDQRARLVDRMNDRPGEGKERHFVPFERERCVPADQVAAPVPLDGAEQDLRLQLDDLVAAPVGDAELQRAAVLIGRDYRLPAEDDGRRRSRKPGKEQARGQRLIHQTHQRFERHDRVGREPVGTDLAVPNRGKGLHAEEERPAEPTTQHLGAGPEQSAFAARHERQGKEQVEPEVHQRDNREKSRPRDGQHPVVGRQRFEDAQARAQDVEGPVAIEQALTAFAADDGAETEVAVACALLGRAPSGKRAGLERRAHPASSDKGEARFRRPEDTVSRPRRGWRA